MFTSHETEADYDNLFNSMKELLKSFNIDFDNLYKNTFIDACQAMSNSIKKKFPDFNIIMCYFHMKANIRSRKSSIPKSKHLTILMGFPSYTFP